MPKYKIKYKCHLLTHGEAVQEGDRPEFAVHELQGRKQELAPEGFSVVDRLTILGVEEIQESEKSAPASE